LYPDDPLLLRRQRDISACFFEIGCPCNERSLLRGVPPDVERAAGNVHNAGAGDGGVLYGVVRLNEFVRPLVHRRGLEDLLELSDRVRCEVTHDADAEAVARRRGLPCLSQAGEKTDARFRARRPAV